MRDNSGFNKFLFFSFAALFATLIFIPGVAHANPYAAPTFNISTFLANFWGNVCKEDADHGLVERFVLCTRMTVKNVFGYFIYHVYPAFSGAITAAMTFAIILFGLKALSGGMDNVARSCMLMALKLACVMYFTMNLDWVFDTFIAIMDSLLNMVSRYAVIGSGSPLSALKCEFTLQFGPVTINPASLFSSEWPFWKRVDCIIDGVIGLNKNEFRLSNGLMAFFIYALATGLWGFIVFLLGVVICITLVLCALRAVQIYLMSLIMIAILCIMGVMFIPLILFDNQEIKKLFKKWAITTGGYIIQPVLMFAFLSLLMTVFDVIVYSGKPTLTGGFSSLMYTIAGDKVGNPATFNLQKYMSDNNLWDARTENNFKFFIDPTPFQTSDPCADDQGGLGNVPCMIDPNATAGAFAEIKEGLDFKAIDWAAVGRARTPPFPTIKADMAENVQYNVAASMIMATLAIFVFNTFMTYLPQIIGSLSGGADRIKSGAKAAEAGFTLPGSSGASTLVGKMGSGIEGKLGWR